MALQDDLKQVMGNVLGVAQLVIKEQGALTPFAVALTDTGEALHLAGDDDLEPTDAIERLTSACATSAKSGEYRACAIAFDVRVTHPDSGTEQDAIAVNFDHRENASVIYCVPYDIQGGQVELTEPLTQQGEGKIFGSAPGTVRDGIILPS